MKNLGWAVCFGFLALAGCQNPDQTVFPLPDHAAGTGLKGNVESLLEEQFLVHPMTGEWEDIPYSVLRFDYGKEGQLTRRNEKSGSALATSDTLMYGTNGLLLERRKTERGKGLQEKRLFLHDAEGRQIEFQIFNGAGKLSRKEKTSYNEMGKVSERFVLQQIERAAQATLEVRNRDVYGYSEAGILSQHKRYARDVLVLEEDYVNGNLVQEKRYNAESGHLEALREVKWLRNEYKGLGVEWDGAGNVLKRDTSILDEAGREIYLAEADSTGKLLLRVVREYNAFGQMLSEIYAVQGYSVPSATAIPEMFRDTIQYAFVYDDEGNWVQSDRSRNGEPDVRIRRSISYRTP